MSYSIIIAKLKLSKVAGAYNKYCEYPSPTVDKREAVLWLSAQVDAGKLTIDDINNAPDGSFASAVTVDSAKVDAIGSVASRSESVALDALAKSSAVANLVVDLKKKVKALEANSTSGVDGDAVRNQVAKLIADAFVPFKQAVDDAGAQAVLADMTSAHVVETKTISEVFGVKVVDSRFKEMTVDLWNHPNAPAIDPDFIWSEEILRHLYLSQKHGLNLWFGGAKGTGKSTVAEQFCARTGRNYVRINFHKHTSTEEYIGATGAKGGDTVFEPKDFLMGYTCPSTVILLDELTNADAGELAPLNGFLEPKAKVSFNGVLQTKAQGVLVFVADNTYGNGDDTGRHQGTRPRNSALIDRFDAVIKFNYLPIDKEIKAVVSRTGVKESIARHVLEAINVARQKVETGDVIEAPSIRRVMAFCRALEVMPVHDAWQSCVMMHQPAESHGALDAIYASCINPKFIAEEI
jgi:cobaltochelatase CobS